MRCAFITLITLLGLTTGSWAASDSSANAEAVFARGNAAYAAGHFPEAIKEYEALARTGQWNPALFYDLGNAYYRTGDLGRSILNYERALTLNPNQAEARANLQLVRDQGRALELPPNWIEAHLAFLGRDQYIWVATAAFWAAAAILCGLYFARRRAVVWIFAVVLLSAIAVGAAFAAYQLENGTAGANLAIITQKDIQARLATAETAGAVLALPPGSEIKILSTRGDWSYASLPNDLQGWIPAQSAERVRL